jgi:L-amino acid N-acyltransferase YncA
MLTFRLAQVEDAPELLKIYAPYVEETTISFECVVPSREEFAGRIENIGSFYPYLVAEEDGRILGYAYAHRFAERKAYDWSAEATVYVEKGQRHKGLGRQLYEKLFALLRLQHIVTAYAAVTSSNTASIKFHEKLGFKVAGTYPETGYKFNQWLGLTWLDLKLMIPPAKPQPICPLKEVDPAKVAEILKQV